MSFNPLRDVYITISLIGLLIILLIAIPWSPRAQTPVGPMNQILCNNPATFTAGTGADSQLVAVAAGQRVFICGWHITTTSSTFQQWQIDTGTGSNCGTGRAVLIPAQSVTSNAPAADHVDYAQIQTGQGLALCISAATAVSGIIYTNQF